MNILALDCSTTACGWIVADGSQPLDAGVYVPGSKDWVDRISLIAHQVTHWIGHYDIEAVAYEIPQGNRGNMDTHRKLGAVQFMIEHTARALDCVLILPINVQHVKASGFCKDRPMVALGLLMAELPQWKPPPKRYLGDLADAVGVWHAALAHLRQEGYAWN